MIKRRRPGGPQLVGEYLAVVDAEGYVHLLDRRDAFARGADVHTTTAAGVFGVDEADVDEFQRRLRLVPGVASSSSGDDPAD